MKESFLKNVIGKIRDAKLKNKLVFSYTTVTALAILIISVSTYFYSINTYKDEMKSKSFEIMKQINKSIEYNIKNMDKLVNFLYVKRDYNHNLIIERLTGPKPDVPSSLLSIERDFFSYFNDLVYLRDDCAGIYILGDNGLEFYRSVSGIESSYSTSQMWYTKTMENKGEITIIGTHRQFYLEDGIPVFSFSKQLVNHINKQFIGVMMIDFNLSVIKEICQSINLGENSQIAICDNDFNIIYHSDESLIMKKLQDEIADVVRTDSMGITNIQMEDRDLLVIHNTSDIAEWKLISIIPMKTLIQRWEFIGFVTLLVGVLLLAVMFVISLLLSNSITRPIMHLNSLMKQVGKGDYTVNIESRSADEIGQMKQAFNSMVNKIKELIQKEYKSKLMEREAELKALQAQINPHFLYNTMELISTIAIVEKVPKIDTVAISLARMMRYSIKTAGDIVPLSDELKHVEDFTNIYNMRFDYSIKVRNEINKDYYKLGILKLTIQPLIENAFIHGFQNDILDGSIIISAMEEGNSLLVEISDNGVGMSQEKLEKIRKLLDRDIHETSMEPDSSESIGLRNVNARLALYYGQEYRIFIKSKENEGTKVTLKVPKLVVKEDTI
jgi:two-component system sensor histidine kinase YesM